MRSIELQPDTSPLGRVWVAPTPQRFALFYTGREIDGHLDGDVVAALRRYVSERFGLETALSTCHQVHGVNVVRSRCSANGWCEEASCDALWSDRSGSALGIKVADCLPVTLIDPGSSVVANIHAGWRGAAARIVERALREVERQSNFTPTRGHVFFGPSIRSCCFEVGEEVIDAFRESYGEMVDEMVDRSRGERPYLDLVRINAALLEQLGFPSGSIFDCGICTKCDDRFHSHRRDRSGGRNLAIAAH